MKIPAAQTPAGPRFRFFRSFSALVLREMSSSYGRSPGGYIWAIAEPVAGIAVMTIVFSYFLRSPPLGTNFMYFFSGGILIFGFYGAIWGKTATTLRAVQALIEYPAVSYMDALLARLFLHTMTDLLVMVMVIGGIILIYDLSPILNWAALFNAISMAFLFGLGVGLVNCYLFTMYPLWERVWAIINRPLFFLSGVFYLPESLPEQGRDILLWVPTLHMTSEMRRGMFATYDGVYVSSIYVYTLSLGLITFGLLLLARHHKDMILK